MKQLQIETCPNFLFKNLVRFWSSKMLIKFGHRAMWRKLLSPLDSKEIKLVNPKVNQPWIFTGKIDADAEVLILWPPDAKSQLTGKDPDAGKDWGQEEKGATEYEMVGWHHWLNGPEFEQTLKDSEGQGSLACCSPCWVAKSQTRLSNWTTTICLPWVPGLEERFWAKTPKMCHKSKQRMSISV